MEEDDTLKKLYEELGPQWKEIALRIPGRKDDQKPWASLEDALLLQLFEEHGPKWTAIADYLPGRSPLACRNRSRKYLNTSVDQRDQIVQGYEPGGDQTNESLHGKTSEESESIDVLLNWSFPYLTDDIQPNSANPPEPLQFDYSLCQSSAPDISRDGPAQDAPERPSPSMQGVQQIFDASDASIPQGIDNTDYDQISQWISSLGSDLPSMGQLHNISPSNQNPADMQTIPSCFGVHV
ncbi:uncharacterized protein I206_106818 [Kwoniella pini CBS 10737]|uniref:Myb-like domain-containing protein n=1 Tax=Kwoniella pini CBS 10737 TaxID=1296096 RepID=A0AAJ8L9W1_9TREE